MAGDPRASRLVVWVLRSLSDREKLPWHRVINSSGRISLQGEGEALQRRLLEHEGIRFDEKGKIPLGLYQWRG
jgi:methylated-DNA-protein-cysteine methyltransferase-like protein